MYAEFGISDEIEKLASEVEEEVYNEYKKINNICEKNSIKVLNAFRYYNVSEMHFNSTSGYGYNDIGRDKIEKVYSQIFKSEDALVRSQIISGTHAITIAFTFLASKKSIPCFVNCTILSLDLLP